MDPNKSGGPLRFQPSEPQKTRTKVRLQSRREITTKRPSRKRAGFLIRQQRVAERAATQSGRRTSDFHRLFNLDRINPLWGAPGPDVGGWVFVMMHEDTMENYTFWSVNHLVGDGGWQSMRVYEEHVATQAAEILAEFCGAELVRP